MGQTPGGGTSLANAPPIPAPSAWNIPPAPGRRQRWGVRLGAARARGLGGAPSGLPCDSSLHATGLGRSREQEGGLPPSWGIRLRLLLEGLFSSGGAEVSPLAGPRPSAGRTGLRRLLAQPAAASPLRPAGLQTDRRREPPARAPSSSLKPRSPAPRPVAWKLQQALQPPRRTSRAPATGQPLRDGAHRRRGPRRSRAQLLRVGCVLGTCQVQNLSHRLWQLVGSAGPRNAAPMDPSSPYSYG
ncbi:protein ADM2 isoform X5 [Canis lupus familiaris]|uniref:protein ADM2 isoform X4 n=1 Tax=Canis lupus familiaris TaxID=9615 RepID=UPI0015F1BA54|nr:protein ADM2 isoform X4 [Canis lupus familiaris]XP_038499468.1 protein ADM2 isoform X5 [Canis lupus familiaris]